MTIPINLYAPTVMTIAGWRIAAPSYACRSWRSTMTRFARQHGKAIAIMANDGALIVTKDETRANGVRAESLSPNQVTWRRS